MSTPQIEALHAVGKLGAWDMKGGDFTAAQVRVGPPAITPAIGRRVWYWPSKADLARYAPIEGVSPCDQAWAGMFQADPAQPFDAGVAYVCENPDVLYLTVADHSGQMHRRGPVRKKSALSLPEDSCWEWMPYQVTQAKKAEPVLLPHQLRVVEECEQLSERLDKLVAFLNSPASFDTTKVPREERERLCRQTYPMARYREVLRERIAAFTA